MYRHTEASQNIYLEASSSIKTGRASHSSKHTKSKKRNSAGDAVPHHHRHVAAQESAEPAGGDCSTPQRRSHLIKDFPSSGVSPQSEPLSATRTAGDDGGEGAVAGDVVYRRRAKIRRGMLLDSGSALEFPTECELTLPEASQLARNFVFPGSSHQDDAQASRRRPFAFVGSYGFGGGGGGGRMGAGAGGGGAGSAHRFRSHRAGPQQNMLSLADGARTSPSPPTSGLHTPQPGGGGAGGGRKSARNGVASGRQGGKGAPGARGSSVRFTGGGFDVVHVAPTSVIDDDDEGVFGHNGKAGWRSPRASMAGPSDVFGSNADDGEDESLKAALAIAAAARARELESEEVAATAQLRNARGAVDVSGPASTRKLSCTPRVPEPSADELAASAAAAAAQIAAEDLVEDPALVPAFEFVVDNGHVPVIRPSESEETLFEKSLEKALSYLARLAAAKSYGRRRNNPPPPPGSGAAVDDNGKRTSPRRRRHTPSTTTGSGGSKSKGSSAGANDDKSGDQPRSSFIHDRSSRPADNITESSAASSRRSSAPGCGGASSSSVLPSQSVDPFNSSNNEEVIPFSLIRRFHPTKLHNHQLRTWTTAHSDVRPLAEHDGEQRHRSRVAESMEREWRELAATVLYARSATARRPVSRKKSLRDYTVDELLGQESAEQRKERLLHEEAIKRAEDDLRPATSDQPPSHNGDNTGPRPHGRHPLITLEQGVSFLDPLRGLHVYVWSSYPRASMFFRHYQRLSECLTVEHFSSGLLKTLTMVLYEIETCSVTVTALPILCEDWQSSRLRCTLGDLRFGDRNYLSYMLAQVLWHISLPVRLFEVYAKSQRSLDLHQGQDGCLYILHADRLNDRSGDDGPMAMNPSTPQKGSGNGVRRKGKPGMEAGSDRMSHLKRGAIVQVTGGGANSEGESGEEGSLVRRGSRAFTGGTVDVYAALGGGGSGGGGRRGSVAAQTGSAQSAVVLATMLYRSKWDFRKHFDAFQLATPTLLAAKNVEPDALRSNTDVVAKLWVEYVTETVIPEATDALVKEAHNTMARINDHFVLAHRSKDEKLENAIADMVTRGAVKTVMHSFHLPLAAMVLVLRCCNDGNFGDDSSAGFSRHSRQTLERRTGSDSDRPLGGDAEDSDKNNSNENQPGELSEETASPKNSGMTKLQAERHAEDTIARRVAMRTIKAEMLGRAAKQALRAHFAYFRGPVSEHLQLQVVNRMIRLVKDPQEREGKQFWEEALLPLARRKFRLYRGSHDLIYSDHRMIPSIAVIQRMLDLHPFVKQPRMQYALSGLASFTALPVSVKTGKYVALTRVGELNFYYGLTYSTLFVDEHVVGLIAHTQPRDELVSLSAKVPYTISSVCASVSLLSSGLAPYAAAAPLLGSTIDATETRRMLALIRLQQVGSIARHALWVKAWLRMLRTADAATSALRRELLAIWEEDSAALPRAIEDLRSAAIDRLSVTDTSATFVLAGNDYSYFGLQAAEAGNVEGGPKQRFLTWALRNKEMTSHEHTAFAVGRDDEGDTTGAEEESASPLSSGQQPANSSTTTVPQGAATAPPPGGGAAKSSRKRHAKTAAGVTVVVSQPPPSQSSQSSAASALLIAASASAPVFGTKSCGHPCFVTAQVHLLLLLMRYDQNVVQGLSRSLDVMRFGEIETNDGGLSRFAVASAVLQVARIISFHGILDGATATTGGGSDTIGKATEIPALAKSSQISAPPAPPSGRRPAPPPPPPPNATSAAGGLLNRPAPITTANAAAAASQTGRPRGGRNSLGLTSPMPKEKRSPSFSTVPPVGAGGEDERVATFAVTNIDAAYAAPCARDEDVNRWFVLGFNLVASEVLRQPEDLMDFVPIEETLVAVGDGMVTRTSLQISQFLAFSLERYGSVLRGDGRRDGDKRRNVLLRAMSTYSRYGRLLILTDVVAAWEDILEESVYRSNPFGIPDFESDGSIRSLLLVVLSGCAAVSDAPRVACLRRLLHRVEADERRMVAALQNHLESQVLGNMYWLFRQTASLELLRRVSEEMQKRGPAAQDARSRLETFLEFHRKFLQQVRMLQVIGRCYVVRRNLYPSWVDFDAKRTEARIAAEVLRQQEEKLRAYEEAQQRERAAADAAQAMQKVNSGLFFGAGNRRKKSYTTSFQVDGAADRADNDGSTQNSAFFQTVSMLVSSDTHLDVTKKGRRDRAASIFLLPTAAGSTSADFSGTSSRHRSIVAPAAEDPTGASIVGTAANRRQSVRRMTSVYGDSSISTSSAFDGRRGTRHFDSGVSFLFCSTGVAPNSDEGHDRPGNDGESTTQLDDGGQSPGGHRPLWVSPRPPKYKQPDKALTFGRCPRRTVPLSSFDDPNDPFALERDGIYQLLRKLFIYCDSDRDGHVTADEVILASEELQLPFFMGELRRIFGESEFRFVKNLCGRKFTFAEFEEAVMSGCGLA